MKSYLLLGISVLLLLFTLPKPSATAGRWVNSEQPVLKKACDKKKPTARRTCKKKCLRHQTHSSQENNTGTVPDCGPTTFAFLANSPVSLSYPILALQKTSGNWVATRYLPPPLKREPNPPRVS